MTSLPVHGYIPDNFSASHQQQQQQQPPPLLLRLILKRWVNALHQPDMILCHRLDETLLRPVLISLSVCLITSLAGTSRNL